MSSPSYYIDSFRKKLRILSFLSLSFDLTLWSSNIRYSSSSLALPVLTKLIFWVDDVSWVTKCSSSSRTRSSIFALFSPLRTIESSLWTFCACSLESWSFDKLYFSFLNYSFTSSRCWWCLSSFLRSPPKNCCFRTSGSVCSPVCIISLRLARACFSIYDRFSLIFISSLFSFFLILKRLPLASLAALSFYALIFFIFKASSF